jgi:hypothetical protein
LRIAPAGVAAGAVLLLIFLAACGTPPASPTPSPTPTEPPPYEVGTVTVVSEGAEYEPYAFSWCSVDWVEGLGRLSGDSMPPDKQELFDTLTPIPYADDFKVVIDGRYAERAIYHWYNDSLAPLAGPGLYFYGPKRPKEAGEYLLCVEMFWSNLEPDDSEYQLYTGMHYYVRVSVLSDGESA